jgi:hypothetical protein
MLAFAYVVHLLADEFTTLCRGRFSLARILTCALDRFAFWHLISKNRVNRRGRNYRSSYGDFRRLRSPQ